MKSPDREPIIPRRRSSTLHYHTFDTPPPKSRGRPNSGQSASSASGEESRQHHHDPAHEPGHESPLPKKQMLTLAFIALCEQTAFNSISPYLPDMASSFPGVEPDQVGTYVGMLGTAFAVAQLITNYFWGWISDRVGRRPIILLGTILTALSFVLFGFCTRFWQAVAVQALMGTVNGNQGLVSTCLGEITDKSNQSKAFTYLPVLYGVGGITGPLLGGLLVIRQNPFNKAEPNPFPYLAPNLLSAAILIIDFIVSLIFLEESLEDAESLPKFGRKIRDMFAWFWEMTSFAQRPRTVRPRDHISYRVVREPSAVSQEHDSDLDSASEASSHHHLHELTRGELLNRDTVLLLLTYLIFALCNIAFNALFPIFSQAAPPIGRGLTPSEIGLSQGFTGVVTIIFQICIFGQLRNKMGNRWSYRAGLFGFVVSFILMPFVGYKGHDAGKRGVSGSTAFLAIELCTVLLIKTVAAVGGLTSALLLVSLHTLS